MGFLDSLRKALQGGGGVTRTPEVFWTYVRCKRCGEPLKSRIDLRNDASQADGGEGYVVRKGLVGSGARRCFQTVEVTLIFDGEKRRVVDREISGGEFITEDEYRRLLQTPISADTDQ